MARLHLPDWRDPRTRARLIIWLGVAAMVVVAFAASAMAWTSRKGFCSDFCHEMAPDIAAYDRSVHAHVSCYGCHMHAGTNPAGFAMEKAKKMGELYLHFTNKYEFPLNHGSGIVYEAKVRQDECVQCHSPETREFTFRTGIIVDHKAHADRKIGCPVCHNRVAHPGVAAYEDFTSMEACFRCHTHEKVASKGPDAAGDARDAGARAEPAAAHGEGAAEGETAPDGEATPHGEGAPPADPLEEGRHELAKAGLAFDAPGACGACHPKGFELEPPAHDKKGWLPEAHHASYEKAEAPAKPAEYEIAELTEPAEHHAPGDEKPCDVCHPQRFCDDCHGVAMPHPADFQQTHKKLSDRSQACRKCHGGEQFCNRCHHGNVPTLKGWLAPAGHPAQTKDEGAEGCFKCHDPRFCNVCHVSGKRDERYL